MAKRSRSREDSITENESSPVQNTHEKDEMPSESHTPKYAQLERQSNQTIIKCSLPPHQTLAFSNYQGYETHYAQSHTNRCSECRKNFPSAHFLDLHLSEAHDPIVGTRRYRGEKTYACFVEGCDKLCRDWMKRKSHLVDKHLFPKNYDFFIVNSGIDGRRSMLRPGIDAHGHRKSSRERRCSSATDATQSTEATSVSQQTGDVEAAAPAIAKTTESIEDAVMDSVTKSMSSLQFVPRSVTFGKRKGKSGFAKS
jgi:hypothetical protein